MALIHRDVKPGQRADRGPPRVPDRLRADQAPRAARKRGSPAPATWSGTIHYVAPEQIEGGDGRRAHRRLLARLPALPLPHRARCRSRATPTSAVIYAHLSEDAAEAHRRARRTCRTGLDAVIAKALDKSPDRRFAACGDLMSAARAVIDAAGPLPRPSPGRGVPAGGERRTSRPRSPRACRDARRRRPDAERRARCCSPGSTQRTRAIVAGGARRPRARSSEARERRRRCWTPIARPPAGPRDRSTGTRPRWRRATCVGALRADPVTRDVEGAAGGATTSRRAAARWRAAGADETLATPFSPLQLQVKLRKLLGADAVAI